MDPNNNLTPFTVNEDENPKSKMHQHNNGKATFNQPLPPPFHHQPTPNNKHPPYYTGQQNRTSATLTTPTFNPQSPKQISFHQQYPATDSENSPSSQPDNTSRSSSLQQSPNLGQTEEMSRHQIETEIVKLKQLLNPPSSSNVNPSDYSYLIEPNSKTPINPYSKTTAAETLTFPKVKSPFIYNQYIRQLQNNINSSKTKQVVLTINQGATSSISDLNIEGVIAYYKNLKILNAQQRERIAFDCTLSHLLTHINDALQTFLNDKTNQSILHHFTTRLQALMSKHPDINQHHHAELLITNTNALDNNGAINLIAFQEALKNFNRDSLTQSINSLVEHRYTERHSIMSHVKAIQNFNNLHQLLLESAQDDSQNKANIIRAVSNSSFPGPPNIKHLLSNTNNTNVTDMKNKIVEILQTS